MLSILIPTYNYVCTDLVRDLQKQAARLDCPYEILVADDGSAETFKSANRTISSMPCCKYVELPDNVGRARIRNILGRMARYDWLLFMDCDAVVVREDFLARYMAARLQAKVVYGGLVHPARLPSPDVALSYYYEKNAEPRFTPERRMKHPYKVFRTFNFMVERATFLAHPFDEEIAMYGHEDTLFGKGLQDGGIPILHIDNPLLNNGLDKSLPFLDKTEESLRTLYVHREKLTGHSGVLNLYAHLERRGCSRLVAGLFRLLRKALRRNLTGCHPSLYLYAFYKIGYFCMLSHKGAIFLTGEEQNAHR